MNAGPRWTGDANDDTEFKKMKHIKTTTAIARVPEKAMDTQTILYIVGSVFTGIGTILIGVSSSIDPKILE